MKKFSIVILLVISLALGGCAGMSDTEQRTLSGGAIGAGTGAVVGAIAGNTGLGLAVGAAAGAVSGRAGEGAAQGAIYGGTRSGLDADEEKQKVFKRCLRGRGYRVLN